MEKGKRLITDEQDRKGIYYNEAVTNDEFKSEFIHSKQNKLTSILYDGLSSLVPGTGELYNTFYGNSDSKDEKRFE